MSELVQGRIHSRQPNKLTYTLTEYLTSSLNLMWHGFGMWAEASALRGNLHKHGKEIEIEGDRDAHSELLDCQAHMLTT